MKVLILAAGYGTRLDRDLRNDSSGIYSSLIGVPKPLLPIGKRPLVSRWVENLLENGVQDIFVVTNARFYNKFLEWAKEWSEVKVVSDGTTSNETRLGAVACIELAIKEFSIDDNLLVIGGDTLFYSDFSLAKLCKVLEKKHSVEDFGGVVIGCKCKDEETHKYGILEVDEDNKVTSLVEKPSPEATSSRLACPCCYLLSKKSLPLVAEFLEIKKDCPIKERDATGYFISHLQTRLSLYMVEVSGRFDVGGLESYRHCYEYFAAKDKV